MELVKWIFWWMVAAASGGLLLALLTAIKVRYPSWLRLAHGGLAFAGLVTLVYALFSGGPDASIPQAAFWALGLLVAAFLGGALFFWGAVP